jgi:hypothetical protein
VETH